MKSDLYQIATEKDLSDPLSKFRNEFNFPSNEAGDESIYLCGNSLGLMPKRVKKYMLEELEDWGKLGVEGHTDARHPWMPYHEFLTDNMAIVVGAKPQEVVIMNSLTVNLHLLMVSFYRPNKDKYKILMEYSPFPSDRYALESQVKFHGYDPQTAIIELKPEPGAYHVSNDQIFATLEAHGDEIALILMGGVNYYTGQAYDIASITKWGHKKGCLVGFDLAHATGNLKLSLHDDGPDFAAWCNYKYMNGGPGALSGIFVHERHSRNFSLPRFQGWWGHDKNTRFKMGDTFVPMAGAEGWQLSNPPIFSMVPIRASLEIFKEAGMDACRKKSVDLTAFLIRCLNEATLNSLEIITPENPEERGCQLSIRMINPDKTLFQAITKKNVIADWREPDVIRVAPVPLYNSFEDVYRFVEILASEING